MNSTVVLTKVGNNYFLESGEPVFVLRAQDELATSAVFYWAATAESRGVDRALIDEARAHAHVMRQWPTKKMPS